MVMVVGDERDADRRAALDNAKGCPRNSTTVACRLSAAGRGDVEGAEISPVVVVDDEGLAHNVLCHRHSVDDVLSLPVSNRLRRPCHGSDVGCYDIGGS